ncbi:hypothetical protein ACFVZD_29460 [Streptomyces sp. NPDC058287]|uniref:hypothetical protein n=1 Tax=unclassified Streptomyces TaxID=2593676 RepID=UPI0036E8FEC3
MATANAPRVLPADEPTGELDAASGEEVFTALRRANEELGATVLVVTHDPLVSGQVRRTVRIREAVRRRRPCANAGERERSSRFWTGGQAAAAAGLRGAVRGARAGSAHG